MSWTIRVFARTPIVKVVTPIAVLAGLDIVAVGLLGEGANPLRSLEVVGAVNDLNVPEIAGLPEPFFRKMAASHLS